MPNSNISDTIVRKELYASTDRFQFLTGWVGISLNMVWFISDYFIVTDYLFSFFMFRFSVGLSSAVLFLIRKRFQIPIYICTFYLAFGISIQNAYMWSVMDVAHFQQHAFAYVVLFIGVGMLVLWEMKQSMILIIGSIIANIAFYKVNSGLTIDEFLLNGGLITLSVLIFCVFLIRSRYRLTFNEIKIRMELAQSKKIVEQKNTELTNQKIEIQNQKDTLEAKNREITDSINYASNIQNALIPSEEKFNSHFKDSFVLFKPKDIVSGDFYWVYANEEYTFYVTADCTGHGVPGGFMTMLGLSFLDQIIVGQNIQEPSEVLDLMRDKIISTLNQSDRVLENKDGMDIAVCRINKATNELRFSSANNDLYIIRNNAGDKTKTLEVYKANRQPCGQHILNKPFTSQNISLSKGDCIYTFTDGYADQFGGPKGKKFRYKQFQQMLLNNCHMSFPAQKIVLNDNIDMWRGTHEQVDDILVIGVRV